MFFAVQGRIFLQLKILKAPSSLDEGISTYIDPCPYKIFNSRVSFKMLLSMCLAIVERVTFRIALSKKLA